MELFYNFKDLGVIDFLLTGSSQTSRRTKVFCLFFLISKCFQQIKKKVEIQIIDYLDNFIQVNYKNKLREILIKIYIIYMKRFFETS